MPKKKKALNKKNKLQRGELIWAVVALTFLLVYALLVRLSHIEASPFPLALDPYYHMADSAAISAAGKMTEIASFDVAKSYIVYPPLLAILGALADRLGLDLIAFYRYFSLVITAGVGILFFVLLRAFFRPLPAAVGAASYLFLPYVAHRTILTLPENLNLIWLLGILTLTAYYPRLEHHWQRILFIGGGLGLLFLAKQTHTTFLIGLLILGTFFLMKLVQARAWGTALALVIAGLLAAPPVLSRVGIPGEWSFALPTGELIGLHFGWIPFLFGTLGLLGIFIFGVRSRAHWPWFAAVTLPLVLFWLFYRGAGEVGSVGAVEIERWLLFIGWLLAFGISWIIEQLMALKNPVFISLLLLILGISIFQPRVSHPWPAVFDSHELEAAVYIRDEMSEAGIYYSQPILEWLLRGLSHRYVVWDAYENAARLRDKSVVQLASEASSTFHTSLAFIVFSRHQNDPQSITELSDGTTRAIDFSVALETPNISETKFRCLPVVWENEAVIIYQLLPPIPTTC